VTRPAGIWTELILHRGLADRLLNGAGTLRDLACLIEGLRATAADARQQGTLAPAAATELDTFADALAQARTQRDLNTVNLQYIIDHLAALASCGGAS
jgi:hypothetical protein